MRDSYFYVDGKLYAFDDDDVLIDELISLDEIESIN